MEWSLFSEFITTKPNVNIKKHSSWRVLGRQQAETVDRNRLDRLAPGHLVGRADCRRRPQGAAISVDCDQEDD